MHIRQAHQTKSEARFGLRGKTVGALIVSTLLAVASAHAQDESEPEVLVEGIDNGFFVAADVKFSEVDDRFASFFGVYGGWLINHRFLLGAGGYGMTNRVHELQMGYGGVVLEYFVNPNRLMNLSFKGLIGAGGSSIAWWDPFFVAEPEAKMTLNVTERFRVGFGGGYRFVGGAGGRDARLRGFTANVDLKFGVF